MKKENFAHSQFLLFRAEQSKGQCDSLNSDAFEDTLHYICLAHATAHQTGGGNSSNSSAEHAPCSDATWALFRFVYFRHSLRLFVCLLVNCHLPPTSLSAFIHMEVWAMGTKLGASSCCSHAFNQAPVWLHSVGNIHKLASTRMTRCSVVHCSHLENCWCHAIS